MKPKASRLLASSQLVLCLTALPMMAASIDWDGSDTITPGAQGGAGTWDSNSTLNWWDGSANIVWPDTGTDNDAIFGGIAGAVTIAAGGVTANDLTFNTTGYLLSGGILTLNGTTPTITTDTAASAEISSAITGTSGLTKAGAGSVLLSGNNTYTGTSLVTDGTLGLSGTNTLGNLAVNGATALARVTGGSTTINSTGGDTFVTGGALEIDGGALTLQGAGTWVTLKGAVTLQSGSFTTNNFYGFTTGDGTGTISINGGNFTANGGFNNGIILGEFVGGNGTLNLNGGVLITDQIRGGSAVGVVNFNGGKLQATGDVADVFANNNNITTTILAGGLTVGGTPNFTISEEMGGTGGITKEDANTVTLSGNNNYSGATQVNSGAIVVNGVLNSDVTVADGAGFGGAGQTSGSLTFEPGIHDFLFDPSAGTSFFADTITATGATITVVPQGVITFVTDKVILESSSPLNLANFVSGNSQLSLSLDGTGTQLLATIGGFTWLGSDATNPTWWDNGVTANWATPTPGVFNAGDTVIFDDSAVPASPVTVDVQDAVLPGDISFLNSAKDYVVSGEAITGTTGVTVSGGGKVTLSNSNNYSGATLVTDGTLELSGTNSNGDLKVDGPGALLQVTGGATTVLNTISPGFVGNSYITGGGSVEINGGSLVTTGPGTYFSIGDHPLVPDGDGTLTLNSGSFTNTNGWGVTVGSGNAGVGIVNINGGIFTADDGLQYGVTLGENVGGNGTLNLNGGVLITDGIRAGGGAGTVNFNGGKLESTGGSPDIMVSSANRTTTIQAGGLIVGGTPDFSISEEMGGTGGLTKEDANTVTLTGLNTYTGDTTVNAGVLAIGQAYLADSSAVTIATGAQMALNFTGDDTVASVTLGGTTYTTPGSYNATTYPDFFTGDGSLLIPGAASDYDDWMALYPSITDPNDKLSTADPDGDGLTNQEEYAFGLAPDSGASVNPILAQLDKTAGTFSYQRRSSTGLTYTIWTSTDLVTWTEDTTASSGQVPGTPDGNNVQSVDVTLSGAPLTADKLFVRVKAE